MLKLRSVNCFDLSIRFGTMAEHVNAILQQCVHAFTTYFLVFRFIAGIMLCAFIQQYYRGIMHIAV